ncbi:hypothetical protein FIBSPDRAFT_275397 [Athelia psychrophila]|uniref:Uncharacterized protein n=1 Tax=Athelia psychrophila TaxID=1759441 RepID=A0A166RC89_9AGAM|nr:hypothetical protein FIBSPDRAFT_275397 [Fibularhizoctonia sp. CBS 109695]
MPPHDAMKSQPRSRNTTRRSAHRRRSPLVVEAPHASSVSLGVWAVHRHPPTPRWLVRSPSLSAATRTTPPPSVLVLRLVAVPLSKIFSRMLPHSLPPTFYARHPPRPSKLSLLFSIHTSAYMCHPSPPRTSAKDTKIMWSVLSSTNGHKLGALRHSPAVVMRMTGKENMPAHFYLRSCVAPAPPPTMSPFIRKAVQAMKKWDADIAEDPFWAEV